MKEDFPQKQPAFFKLLHKIKTIQKKCPGDLILSVENKLNRRKFCEVKFSNFRKLFQLFNNNKIDILTLHEWSKLVHFAGKKPKKIYFCKLARCDNSLNLEPLVSESELWVFPIPDSTVPISSSLSVVSNVSDSVPFAAPTSVPSIPCLQTNVTRSNKRRKNSSISHTPNFNLIPSNRQHLTTLHPLNQFNLPSYSQPHMHPCYNFSPLVYNNIHPLNQFSFPSISQPQPYIHPYTNIYHQAHNNIQQNNQFNSQPNFQSPLTNHFYLQFNHSFQNSFNFIPDLTQNNLVPSCPLN